MPEIDQNELADIAYEDPLPEPDYIILEKTERNVTLKATATADYARFECETKEVCFKPTLMYTTRVHKFSVKNTSLITTKYSMKIVSAETGVLDAGYFSVTPKTGTIAPGCDEFFTVKFSPTEVDYTNSRLLVCSIEHLSPDLEPLILELDGEAERPICHFELPPSNLREKKEYADLDTKYNVVEFLSLGTKTKNVKRFYVVNPTNQGYEFTWSVDEDPRVSSGNHNKELGNFFKC